MYYVYSKRCQPFSKLNEKELEWLVENTGAEDRIIIGIVNYNPLRFDERDNMTEDERYEYKYNPLSYWERYRQIYRYVREKQKEDARYLKIAAIVPSPRPSVNIQTALNYFPPKEECNFCVSDLHGNDYEERKLYGYKKQGITNLVKIPSYSFNVELKIISPELIFCLMVLADDLWKKFVCAPTVEYLEALQIKRRIATAGLDADTAKERLQKIHRRAPEDEKKLLGELLFRYVTSRSTEEKPKFVDAVILKDIVNSIFSTEIITIQQEISNLTKTIKSLGETPTGRGISVKKELLETCLVKLDLFLAQEQSKSGTVSMSELEQYRSGLEKKLKTYLERTEKYIDEIVLLVRQKDGIDRDTLEIHKEALKSFQLG